MGIFWSSLQNLAGLCGCVAVRTFPWLYYRDAGVVALCSSFRGEGAQLPLEELLLHACGLTASGVEALAGSSLTAHITHLNLAQNPCLTADAAPHLAALLKRPKLRRLQLQGTCIGDEGAAAVLDAAAQQGSLEVLDLSSVGLGERAG